VFSRNAIPSVLIYIREGLKWIFRLHVGRGAKSIFWNNTKHVQELLKTLKICLGWDFTLQFTVDMLMLLRLSAM